MSNKVLFICKRNECYGFSTYTRRSSGLYNSTRFIVEGLSKRGIEANIIEVQDNNDIDRAVSKYKPDIVVIEALWVVPEKFPILMRLHPGVQWFVHLHSHMPFLALEGIAMEWIRKYAMGGVGLIANSLESFEAIQCILKTDELIFLPNVYITHPRRAELKENGIMSHVLDIGCFGAMRPLKNHLLQALAAIEFARQKKKWLNFHINSSRTETGGEPVLKNLRNLFAHQPNCRLIEHRWMEPDEFIHFLQSHIDIGMQVSLSETFNVVSADYVTAGIPVVVSKEVYWVSNFNKAKDNSIPDIVKVLKRVYKNRPAVKWNQKLLINYSKHAQKMWFDFVNEDY